MPPYTCRGWNCANGLLKVYPRGGMVDDRFFMKGSVEYLDLSYIPDTLSSTSPQQIIFQLLHNGNVIHKYTSNLQVGYNTNKDIHYGWYNTEYFYRFNQLPISSGMLTLEMKIDS